MPRPSNRDNIIDAYIAVIAEQGAAAATLDAVAERAQVSKGGLLYHFGSKAELHGALRSRLAEKVDAFNATAPSDPAELIHWYLDTAGDDDDDEDSLWLSLLASIHVLDEEIGAEGEPEPTLATLLARYSERLDGLDPMLAHKVRLVGDGIYFNRLCGTPPLPAEVRKRLADDLAAEI